MEVKQPTTYEWQINKLKTRGCIIDDEERCKEILSQVNYYRLNAYFLPFRKGMNYRDGTNFIQVHMMYEFDRKLRSLIFRAIEEIEIYVRSQVAYYHAHKYGSLRNDLSRTYYL